MSEFSLSSRPFNLACIWYIQTHARVRMSMSILLNVTSLVWNRFSFLGLMGIFSGKLSTAIQTKNDSDAWLPTEELANLIRIGSPLKRIRRAASNPKRDLTARKNELMDWADEFNQSFQNLISRPMSARTFPTGQRSTSSKVL